VIDTMVRSRAVPRGDGLLEKTTATAPVTTTASTASVPSGNNDKKAKITKGNANADVDVDASPGVASLGADSGTHLLGEDYDPESTTIIFYKEKKTPNSKAKKDQKEKQKQSPGHNSDPDDCQRFHKGQGKERCRPGCQN